MRRTVWIKVLGAAGVLLPAVALALPPGDVTRVGASGGRSAISSGPSLSAPQSRSAAYRQRTGTYRPSMGMGSAPPQASVLPSYPGSVARPPIGNVRPSPGYRPPTSGYRPSPGYRPPVGRPDQTIVNNINNINNIANINNNYNSYHSHHQYRPYYSQLHYHWRPSWWSGWYRPMYTNYYSSVTTSGSFFSVGGVTVGFANPFYVRPTVVTALGFDYSAPLRVPSVDYRETREDLIRSEQAISRFDAAREYFRAGLYDQSRAMIDEAIARLPTDPTLHQFRALVLFAQQRYPEAAAVIYSVLAVAQGWDYETVSRLYDDPNRYESHLRSLTMYVISNPDSADARFLLAYHSLVLGDLATAEQQLERVLRANPADRVTQNLLDGVRAQARLR